LAVWVWDGVQATILFWKVFNGVRHEAGRAVESWTTLITPANSPAPATLVWHTVPFELHDLMVL
jgi:hypothetical protein